MKKMFLFFQSFTHCISRSFITAILLFLASMVSNAQSTGYINRPATVAAGRTVLDPNGDGYTSKTSSGFAGDDVGNSEIPYRSVPAFSQEPFGDLRRGPSHLYSDFVPDANNVGYYTYFDGSNLLFRMRMGSVMPGSKGYSVLLDTDGKFGATGSNADPNYQPATTGTNGNPGFEIEIVLETNFRIAIYNVDGSSTPSLVKAYTNWQDMSQVSVAGTFDNGDPDFFIDFYVPFSDLQAAPFSLTTSTQLRMIATTVMSPQPAIGGPKSDLYGLSDTGYKSTNDEYEAYINAQPVFTAGGLTSGGIGTMCTSPPVIASPISTGTVTISGTWTKSTLSGAAGTATITVYKNGTSIGTVPNVSSGGNWTLSGIALINGDIITAKAQASGESMCLVSNAVTAQGCNTSNIPSTSGFTIGCTSIRGVEGTFVTGNEVKLYFIDPATLATSTLAGPSANSPTFGYSGTNWYYNGTNYNGTQIASACSGGGPDMNNGVYYATTNVAGQSCESAPVFGCVGLSGTTATPVITQTALYASSTQVSGTAATGAQVRLWINGQLKATTTATGGNYSFTGLSLAIGDVIDVRALSTNSCMSGVSSLTVTCFTTPPLINVDNNNQLTAGQAITGTSSEPAGTVVKVYTSGNSLVSTITVQSDGTWTTAPFTAASGTSFYAKAQNGSCGLSPASGTFAAVTSTSGRCGSINTPVTALDAAVSGTITGSVASTTVNLYLDGIKIGSAVTGTNTWSITTSSLTYPLYANGVLSIGVQESGKQEQYCSSSAVTVSCNTGPPKPVVSPSSSTLTAGQTQTYTISNAVTGAFYGLADGATGLSLGDGIWATSSTVNLTTKTFSSGSYTVVVKGSSLSGVSVCSSPGASASVVVSSTLPLTLLEFNASRNQNTVYLNWVTQSETGTDHFEVERSAEGIHFIKLGEVALVNAPGKNLYGFSDKQPLSLNYYRLKLVDKDGRYSYSKTVSIREDDRTVFGVQPNPLRSSITITIGLAEAQKLRLEILDVNGKTVLTTAARGEKGMNCILVEGMELLKPGFYFLRVKSEAGVMYGIQKLVKTE